MATTIETIHTTLTYTPEATVEAMNRLVDVAMGDTGQSRRVADFLLAWWNGQEHGHFEIAHLFGVDTTIALDMATVVAFIASYPGAVYPDALGLRDQMAELVDVWRPAGEGAAGRSAR